jgi:hypothetical protein
LLKQACGRFSAASKRRGFCSAGLIAETGLRPFQQRRAKGVASARLVRLLKQACGRFSNGEQKAWLLLGWSDC